MNPSWSNVNVHTFTITVLHKIWTYKDMSPLPFPKLFLSVVGVRMWSRTFIVQDVRAEPADLESASVSTRGKRRTCCATSNTKPYVSFLLLFILSRRGQQLKNSNKSLLLTSVLKMVWKWTRRKARIVHLSVSYEARVEDDARLKSTLSLSFEMV